MSELTNIRSVSRKGTSQSQRLSEKLKPENFPLDDRSTKTLLEYAEDYAEVIKYFDAGNEESGDWSQFFPSDLASRVVDGKEEALIARPHVALFYAFLKIFAHSQEHLNTLPKRHLDYFYKTYLHFKEKPAVADQAHVLFELAKFVENYELNPETKVSAGKDNTGVKLVYETLKKIILNKAAVKSLKTIYNANEAVEDDNGVDRTLYAAAYANSSDGAGEELSTDDPGWPALGEDQSSGAGTMSAASVGFAFASPTLYLAEGKRKITFTFNAANSSLRDYDSYVSETGTEDGESYITVKFSGAKRWIEVNAERTSSSVGSLVLEVVLDASEEPVTAYNSKLSGDYDTTWPIATFIIDPAHYYLFKDVRLSNITVAVEVEDMRDLVIQNDVARLNPNKPFQPFGSRPADKTSFYIGCEEAFAKNCTKIDLELAWAGLPTSDFEDYYETYSKYEDSTNTPVTLSVDGVADAFKNDVFKADVYLLDNYVWQAPETAAEETINLFTTEPEEVGHTTALVSTKTISLTNPGVRSVGQSVGSKKQAYGVTTQDGFIKLELQSFRFGIGVNDETGTDVSTDYPNFVFGHQYFNRIHGEVALERATNEASVQIFPKDAYTPQVSELRLSYDAVASFELDASVEEEPAEQFFHIGPFGQAKQTLAATFKLVPEYSEEGTLYIGIENLDPPENLSLLFQVVEGTATPPTEDVELAVVNWYYLADDTWHEFDKTDILSDTTNQLKTSGIITFSMPKEMTSTNTILPENEFWIKAGITRYSDSVCELIDVKAQAVLVEFKDQNNDPEHLSQTLAANKIKKLVSKDANIKTVSQPYSGFGGKVEEQSNEIYTRVAEQLRHKGRAATAWDIERITLENFPSVYTVKCINHTNEKGRHRHGNVLVVCIPNIRNSNAVNVLEPRNSLNTLDEISKHLTALAPPYVKIHVQNPTYETIKLDFQVKFNAGFDKGFYEEQLQTDLKEYLSPWAFDSEADISFNSQFHKYVIMNFVEELEYVDYVANFKLYYKPEDDKPFELRQVVKTTHPGAILVSYEKHAITILDEDPEPPILGICSMAIERNFSIIKKSDHE